MKIKRQFSCFILLLGALLSVPLMSVAQGTGQNYYAIPQKGFRQNATFNQRLDLNNIDYKLVHATIFYLTNEQRIKKGRKPLSYHEALETAAYWHAEAMATKGFFDHTNRKNRNRRDPSKRVALTGVDNGIPAENIAYCMGYSFDTYLDLGEYFVKAWMKSPGHRANILDKESVQLGAGTYYNAKKRSWHAVHVFQRYRPVTTQGTAVDTLPFE